MGTAFMPLQQRISNLWVEISVCTDDKKMAVLAFVRETAHTTDVATERGCSSILLHRTPYPIQLVVWRTGEFVVL